MPSSSRLHVLVSAAHCTRVCKRLGQQVATHPLGGAAHCSSTGSSSFCVVAPILPGCLVWMHQVAHSDHHTRPPCSIHLMRIVTTPFRNPCVHVSFTALSSPFLSCVCEYVALCGLGFMVHVPACTSKCTSSPFNYIERRVDFLFIAIGGEADVKQRLTVLRFASECAMLQSLFSRKIDLPKTSSATVDV